MRASGLAAGLVAALVFASAAQAGSTACLWERLPETQRKAMLAAYEADGRKGALQQRVPSDAFFQAAQACGVGEDRETLKRASAALGGYAASQMSARRLERQAGMSWASLHAVWVTADPADRKLVRDSLAPDSPRADAASLAALTRLLHGAGWRGRNQGPIFEAYLDFYIGLATSEAFEKSW